MRRNNENVVIVIVDNGENHVVKGLDYSKDTMLCSRYEEYLGVEIYEIYEDAEEGTEYFVTDCSENDFRYGEDTYVLKRGKNFATDGFIDIGYKSEVCRRYKSEVWQNTAMPKQLTWKTTKIVNPDGTLETVGSINAWSDDKKLRFKIDSYPDQNISTVNIGLSTLVFQNHYDEDGFCYFDHECLSHIFCMLANDLHNNGYVCVSEDGLWDSFNKYSEYNSLGLVFEKVWNSVEYCYEMMVYMPEIAKKFHVGEEYDKYDIIYAFTEESALEIMKEEGYYSNLQFEDTWMMYPDCGIDKDQAIVCYKLK